MGVMTLPAEIALSVRRHVDPWDLLRTLSVLRMTLPTEGTRSRFARVNETWIHLVLLTRLVAFRTRQ